MSIQGRLRLQHLFLAMQVLLTLLLVPVCLVALYALYVGITFGFNLWNPQEPAVTLVWLGMVTSPAWFYALLVWSEKSRQRVMVFFGVAAAALLAGIAHALTH